jgi:hypothetical protein
VAQRNSGHIHASLDLKNHNLQDYSSTYGLTEEEKAKMVKQRKLKTVHEQLDSSPT